MGEATAKLIDLCRNGGLVIKPSQTVTNDVPPENVVAMIEVLKAQKGYA